MAEQVEVIRERVQYSGIIDFPALYSAAFSWLYYEENYGVAEEKYVEKVSGNARDIDIEWNANKPLSDYFSIKHKVKWEVRGLTDVEVEIDGKKKKMQKGSVWVEIKGHLTRDAKSQFDVSPLFRFTRELYNKYVVPSRIDALEDKVKSDVRKFKEALKAICEIMGRR